MVIEHLESGEDPRWQDYMDPDELRELYSYEVPDLNDQTEEVGSSDEEMRTDDSSEEEATQAHIDADESGFIPYDELNEVQRAAVDLFRTYNVERLSVSQFSNGRLWKALLTTSTASNRNEKEAAVMRKYHLDPNHFDIFAGAVARARETVARFSNENNQAGSTTPTNMLEWIKEKFREILRKK